MAWVVGLIIPISLPLLGEPEVAVGAGRDPIGLAVGRGDGELGDGVSRRVDHPDLVGIDFGEPEVAVGPGRDPDGRLSAVGMGNSVMAWVVGLISRSALA